MCGRCAENPAGEGGMLCPECLALLKQRAEDPYGAWFEAEKASRG